MEKLSEIARYFVSWGMNPDWAGRLDPWLALVGILVVAYGVDFVCRKLLVRLVAHMVRNTRVTWDDILFDKGVLVHTSRVVAPLIIRLLVPLAFADDGNWWLSLLLKATDIYILLVLLFTINSLLKAVYTIYSEKEQLRNRPLKGLLQTAQVVLWFVGSIVLLGTLIGKDPLALLAGLSASAAILMLVFKDSIMGVVSGVQLSANDMLKVGDWITMPKYGADGSVIEVTLNTVKVQNWDKTITTIPPYALVSDSFQNWRGMRESGGRRVKRSINIDMTSVRFCTPEMLQKYRKINLLSDYIDQTEQVVQAYNKEHDIDNAVLVNGRRQTNLGVFRAYLTAYLKSLPTVNQGMTAMVRHLQPTDRGLPVELYFFTDTVDWIPYEGIQADVFDHLLAIIPEFGLRVFQSPSGADVQELASS